MKKIMLLLLSIACMTALCACEDQSKPEDVIQKMEDAINQRDDDKMLECYAPELQEAFKNDAAFSTGLLEMTFNANTIANGIAGLANVYGQEALFPLVTTTINSSEKVSDDTVKMNVTWKYTFIGNEENYEGDVTENIELSKKDKRWYVVSRGLDLGSLFDESDSTQENIEKNVQKFATTEPIKKSFNITECKQFHNGVAWAKSENGWNLIDTSGTILKNFPNYTLTVDFKGDYSILETENQSYVVVDTNGDIILNMEESGYLAYYLIDYDGFEEGHLIVKKNIDTFEKSGNYFYYYDLQNKQEKELYPVDDYYKPQYAGSGFYYNKNDIMTFYNYRDDVTVSFYDDASVNMNFAGYEIKEWNFVQMKDCVVAVLEGRSGWESLSKGFQIDLAEQKCSPIAVNNVAQEMGFDWTSGYDSSHTWNSGVLLWGRYYYKKYDYETSHYLYDAQNGQMTELSPKTDYDCELIDYSNEKFLATTKNENGTLFYTILDFGMNPLFTPKRYYDTTTLVDKYLISDEEDGSVSVLDITSNSIVQSISEANIAYIDGKRKINHIPDKKSRRIIQREITIHSRAKE